MHLTLLICFTGRSVQKLLLTFVFKGIHQCRVIYSNIGGHTGNFHNECETSTSVIIRSRKITSKLTEHALGLLHTWTMLIWIDSYRRDTLSISSPTNSISHFQWPSNTPRNIKHLLNFKFDFPHSNETSKKSGCKTNNLQSAGMSSGMSNTTVITTSIPQGTPQADTFPETEDYVR